MDIRSILGSISVRSSDIHGKGLFSRKRIKKGTRILEYLGEIITRSEGNRRAERQYKKARENSSRGFVYIFELTRHHDLDGDVPYNIARFINHSCDPNCRYELKNMRVYIRSIKDIKKDQELTMDYGYDIDDYKDHPCNCKTKECRGFILSRQAREKLRKIKGN